MKVSVLVPTPQSGYVLELSIEVRDDLSTFELRRTGDGDSTLVSISELFTRVDHDASGGRGLRHDTQRALDLMGGWFDVVCQELSCMDFVASVVDLHSAGRDVRLEVPVKLRRPPAGVEQGQLTVAWSAIDNAMHQAQLIVGHLWRRRPCSPLFVDNPSSGQSPGSSMRRLAGWFIDLETACRAEAVAIATIALASRGEKLP